MIAKRVNVYLRIISECFNYPLFTSSIGFISGCVWKEYSRLPISFLILFFGSTAVFLFTKKRSWKKGILFLCFFFAFTIGVMRYSSYFSLKEEHVVNRLGQEVCAVGSIKYQPDYRASSIKAVVDVTSIDNVEASGLVLYTLPRYPEYYLGDILELCGELEEPENFDDFDYKEYLRTSNIYIVSKPFTSRKIEEVDNTNIIKLLSNYKQKLSYLVKKDLPQPHASLLLGIEIGSKENMPSFFDENLSLTGTTHIIAVSGYNVTVLLAIILRLAGFIPRKLTLMLSSLFLTLFLLIVGLDNLPAMRAGIMGFAYLISLSIGRRGGLVSFLPLTAAILIYINPIAYKSLSFQLSFVSTLGLIFYSDYFDKLLNQIPEFIRSELSPTLSAMISTSPIILFNFGKLSIISPLVNVLVLPIVPLIMFLGFVYFCLLPFRFLNFGFITYLPLQYMISIINYFGKLGYGHLEFGKISSGFIIVLISILIIFALEQNAKEVLQRKF